MNRANSDYTTLSIRRETKRQLQDVKPYESMSYDELIGEMTESFQENQE